MTVSEKSSSKIVSAIANKVKQFQGTVSFSRQGGIPQIENFHLLSIEH
jgi:hypothetical protein